MKPARWGRSPTPVALMELILLNIGLEAGLISGKLDTILALMTITTTFVANPTAATVRTPAGEVGGRNWPRGPRTPCGGGSVGTLILLGTVGRNSYEARNRDRRSRRSCPGCLRRSDQARRRRTFVRLVEFVDHVDHVDHRQQRRAQPGRCAGEGATSRTGTS